MIFFTDDNNLCAVPENIHTPPTKGIGISSGVGGSVRPKNIKKCMKFNWNFQEGGGLRKKSLPCGRYGYFLELHYYWRRSSFQSTIMCIWKWCPWWSCFVSVLTTVKLFQVKCRVVTKVLSCKLIMSYLSKKQVNSPSEKLAEIMKYVVTIVGSYFE